MLKNEGDGMPLDAIIKAIGIEPLPNKLYQIIYADPPWSYYNDSTAMPNCTTHIGMTRPPYPVMSSLDIMKLPVDSIAAPDCILLIWTTDHHLEKCLNVIRAWGFTYKTVGFLWLKENKNGGIVSFMGAYTLKSGCEICLLATRGNPHKYVRKHNVKSLIISVREKHSKKPDIVRERIVELFGDLSRIELFARQKTDGWDVWGNEI